MSLGKAPWLRWSRVQVSMATLIAETTLHHPTDKAVEILTNPHTYQGQMIKMRKGGGSGSGSKKALNYGKQGSQTANENVAETQSKGPCNKAYKCEPPHMAAANCH